MKDIYVRGSFLGIMVVLVAISLLTYRNLDNYIDEVKMVKHSNKVLSAVQTVLSSVKDAEIGYRGYELTRDTAYLNPYYNSLKYLPGNIKTLDSLLISNERQSKKTDTLGELINNQFRIMSEIISNAKRSSLYLDEYETKLLARGKANMDDIRAVASRITREEEATFNDRVLRETRYRNTAPVALLVYTLVALIGMTFLFIRILEALRNRRIAEVKLKKNVVALNQEAEKREFAQKTLRNVLDNSLDSIMAFKTVRNDVQKPVDFEWTVVNSIGSKLTGNPEDRLIGKRLLEVMPEYRENGLYTTYKDVIESGQSVQFEKRLEKEGVIRWFNIAVVKLEDGIIVTFADITTEKKQRLLIEERGLLLKEAETFANMGSWKWNETTQKMIWSDGLYSIWGIQPHTRVPSWESFLENVVEEDFGEVKSFISNITNTRRSTELRYRIEVGGVLKYLILVVNPRTNPEGPSRDFLGTVIDVTTQRKAEKDMIVAERLSMTGKLARTIAHEVRNPLTSLTLALEQLKDEIQTSENSVTEYCDIIERSANRIEQLIRQMLNSSKPKELSLELTAVPDVIEETITLTTDRINLNQIRLEKNYALDLPRILLDKEKMKIALLNILVNAVEAMEPGKGILRICAYSENGFVIISIGDNGKGIAPRDVEKLFDPFYTAKPGGTGLGLTSAKNILNSHRATIDVSSKLNEGTTFYVYFKLAE